MTSTNKFSALGIGVMAMGLLMASPGFAQTTQSQQAPAQTAQAQKQRTQASGPDCDFSVPTSRLSPDCKNIKEGIDSVKAR